MEGFADRNEGRIINEGESAVLSSCFLVQCRRGQHHR